MSETCENCRFRRGQECHESSPTPLERRYHSVNGRSEGFTGYWPEIELDDWCGKWSAMEE